MYVWLFSIEVLMFKDSILRKNGMILTLLFIFTSFAFADPPVFQSGAVLQNENEELPGDTSGYTAPCIGDWDGDGDKDLLVGTFLDGPIYFFENIAEEGEPVMELAGTLQADGEQINAPYE
jgi:hypothetical protein